MPIRKFPFISGQIYHVFSKSIADYKIFRDQSEFQRMQDLFQYYNQENPAMKFSELLRKKSKDNHFSESHAEGRSSLVRFVAYCLMPTHFHLVVQQLKEGGISAFMKRALDSYTRYFNLKTKRKGPLWESRFKSVSITTDEQLLHLSRYVHLNPATAGLVDNPFHWKFSSYKEFLGEEKQKVCDFSEVLEIQPQDYKNFVENRISYQRELAKIKNLTLEENTHFGSV